MDRRSRSSSRRRIFSIAVHTATNAVSVPALANAAISLKREQGRESFFGHLKSGEDGSLRIAFPDPLINAPVVLGDQRETDYPLDLNRAYAPSGGHRYIFARIRPSTACFQIGLV
jgi:hypothetical protein